MLLAARISLLSVALLWMPFAVAQTTLGALLDAGAKPVTAADFNRELVQHVIVGPTASGGRVEMMYVSNGSISGTGTMAATSSRIPPEAPLAGEWKIGERDTICTTMRIGLNSAGGLMMLPPRCQYWFRLGAEYYLADSDTDRSAKVLSRTIKQ